MSALSGSFPKSSPGLPRGRASLDPDDVHAHQRTRLMRAVISAVAEKGYQATTIADIVERARVSRSVMYRHFGTKQDCFFAAIAAGRDAMIAGLTEAMNAQPDGDLESVAREVSRRYLDICAREPEHTRAWVLELAAAGPEGVAIRADYLDQIAVLMREVDSRFGNAWPQPHEHYVALVGGIGEVVGRVVRAGDAAQLRRLEDVLTGSIVCMLG